VVADTAYTADIFRRRALTVASEVTVTCPVDGEFCVTMTKADPAGQGVEAAGTQYPASEKLAFRRSSSSASRTPPEAAAKARFAALNPSVELEKDMAIKASEIPNSMMTPPIMRMVERAAWPFRENVPTFLLYPIGSNSR
jgi:hypothetical protein